MIITLRTHSGVINYNIGVNELIITFYIYFYVMCANGRRIHRMG